ncbi:receptor-interacting serine/threonine-protein kinase 3-like isoform X2 [Myxocyprinus asiaticus]|uniref:receptor-interacting serine/threonine-protein kinase 3-like isoform X2 n=1 Tax=Myxocyprinus asiaticus TaxID=70543 RepID=UPI002221689E|nr:receptor-interacting serine/threonine-protein kinase 3-like isoform X2 [Myxocyprinus asiaticus]
MDGPNRLIHDDCLECWTLIGSGGFGQIYRAKHTKLGTDVAIKLLLDNDGSTSSLQREANLMFQGGNPNVLWIYGLYEGCRGDARNPSQVGLVMEFMSRGSLADLLQMLGGPPPWPLTFRITHQIGLGMNFLHQLDPPLLHLDLKPSNVLLDDSLNAKLTDFGLSRIARSLSKSFREKDEVEGGTLSYMPPEALESVNYKPNKASDIYSYGVLLWSIITGEEPYADAHSSMVRFRIPLGDRPDLTLIDHSKAEGLDDIVQLMTACWTQKPNQRPSFRDCVHVTEKVFDMHKRGVNVAVHDVLKQLDTVDNPNTQGRKKVVHPQVLPCVTGPPPEQDTVDNSNTQGIKKGDYHQMTSTVGGSRETQSSSAVGNRTVSEILLEHLDELESQEMKTFTWHLTKGVEDFKIAKGRLEKKSRCEVVECMIDYYRTDGAAQLTLIILEKMKMNYLAKQLQEKLQVKDRCSHPSSSGGGKTQSDLLLDYLEQLRAAEVKGFKWFLSQKGNDFPPVPRGKLENKSLEELVSIMIEQYGSFEAGSVMIWILKKMNMNELAMNLEKQLV